MVDKSLPFAEALLSLGQDSGREDELNDNLKQMEAVFEQNPELLQVLGLPAVSGADKAKLLDSIFADSTSRTFQDFLKIVCRHQMAGKLDSIARDYRKLLDAARNIQTVQVTAAAPLTDEQREKLTAALEKKMNCQIRLDEQIDPSLIAGLKIRTPEKMMDASVRGRLEKMKEQLHKS